MKTRRKLGLLTAAVITLGTLAGKTNGAVITLDEFSQSHSRGTTSSPNYSILGVTFSKAYDGPIWGEIGVGNSGSGWLKKMSESILFASFSGGPRTIVQTFDFLSSEFIFGIDPGISTQTND